MDWRALNWSQLAKILLAVAGILILAYLFYKGMTGVLK